MENINTAFDNAAPIFEQLSRKEGKSPQIQTLTIVVCRPDGVEITRYTGSLSLDGAQHDDGGIGTEENQVGRLRPRASPAVNIPP